MIKGKEMLPNEKIGMYWKKEFEVMIGKMINDT